MHQNRASPGARRAAAPDPQAILRQGYTKESKARAARGATSTVRAPPRVGAGASASVARLHPGPMSGLRLDELWQLLPAVEELHPVQDLLLARSVPDPRHAWAASGELETVGQRLVAGGISERDAAELARTAAERSARLYAELGRALTCVASGDRLGAGEALLAIARLEAEHHRPDRARKWARSAFLVCRDEKDQRPAALALRRWGRAARAAGELDEALARYRESYEISHALDEARPAAEAAVGAGNVLEDQGRWLEAEEWYRRALAVLDEHGLDVAPERWHALLNLHITLRSTGRLAESRALLDAAVEAAATDPDALPFLENARGQLRQVEGAHDEAETHFRTALAAASAPGARVVIGVNLAECLLARERHLDAAEAARDAEAQALSARLAPRLPEVYRILGRIAAVRGNPDAFVLFERALEIIGERGLPGIEEARTLQAYAEAEARRGESAAAQELHGRAEVRYAELGIRHPRHPWSEFFAPPPQDATDPSSDTRAGHDS